jgi:hypothetical protein
MREKPNMSIILPIMMVHEMNIRREEESRREVEHAQRMSEATGPNHAAATKDAPKAQPQPASRAIRYFDEQGNLMTILRRR